MTTTSASETSQSTESCVSPDDLKQYLSGWCDDSDAERIESHLTACPACEQALREFEVKPDTLLQMLQTTTVEKAPADDHAISHTADEPIDAALAIARKLMDVPIESARSAWQPASKELGVYELLRPLGRGGMGAVYLAKHRQLHKQVAIKLLPVMSAEDSDVRARFQREIRVVGKLNHPSIVAATDAGEIDGTQFLVMEYVPGMDLSRLARLLGKLTVSDASELMRQVALGLSCAHAEGVVHRDVKPSNLMLDETGRIRILDFGLAQLSYWDEASIELTSVGQLMGTLDYMAPEQAELSGGVDYRADLYAMGATLFRLLCGRPPLAAAPNQSPLEKLRLLANHQPPKLDTLCPEAPPELVKLMSSLLSRSPQDRPASAAHVAEELAAFTESADLVTLLKRAEEKEAESPNVIGSDRNRRDCMPTLARTVDAELQDRERGRTGGLTPPRSPRAIGRWIMAAMLPLLVVGGILIKLETDKGQLVIESEVADVKVRIINDGKPVSELTIKHGTTATRLRADKYEVVIDGPSDGMTIENDQFTLKNGGTVIARIHQKPNTTTATDNRRVLTDEARKRISDAIRRVDTMLGRWKQRGDLPMDLWNKLYDAFHSFPSENAPEHELIDAASKCANVASAVIGDYSNVRWKHDPESQPVYWVQYLSQEMNVVRDQLTQAALQNSTTTNVASKSTRYPEPLYQGKTLPEWLDVMERDRSPQAIADSMRACDAMISATNGPVIGERMWRVLPQIPSDLLVQDTKSFGNVSSELLAFSLLVKAFPTTFYSTWIREYEGGDAALRDRLLRAAWMGTSQQFLENNSTIDMQVFVEWAKNELLTPRNARTEESISKLANILATGFPSQEMEFLESLKRSPNIDVRWWLAPMDTQSDTSSGSGASPLTPIGQERSRVALKVLLDDSSDAVLVAEACMTLSSCPITTPEARGLSDEIKSKVLPIIEMRLNKILQGIPVVLSDTVHVDAKFGQLVTPSVERPRLFVAAAFSQQNSSDHPASVFCELLDLYVNVSPRDHCSEALGKLAELVSSDIIPKLKLSGYRLDQKLGTVGVQWPQVNMYSHLPNRQTTPAEVSAAIWGEDYKPTQDDGFKLILLQHPAVKPYVKLSDSNTDPDMAANLAHTSQPKPALYEGKTLDEWLEMLSRERSPAGLKSALEACQLLVSADNAGRVTATLMEVLPKLNGDMRITSGDSGSVDNMARGILRIANPGADFYKMWVNAIDQANDDAWKKRLQGFAIHAQPKSSSDLEPLVVWAETRLHAPVAANRTTTAESSDAMMAAVLLRGFVGYSQFTNDQPFTERVAGILKSSNHLDQSWWLSQPLIYRGKSDERRLWPAAISNEIVRHAIEALDLADTSPSLVAQACMILANGAELNPEQQAVVVAALARRLSDASTSPEKLTLMVQTGDEFSAISLPEISQDCPLYFLNFQIQVARSYVRDIPVTETSMTLQLLNLARKLDQGESFRPQFEQILAATKSTFEIINLQRLKFASNNTGPNRSRSGFGGRQPGGFNVEISWPTLKSSAPRGSLGLGPGGTDATKIIWGDHDPTPTDWHQYLILLHPVMKDIVDAAVAESDPP